MNPVLAFCLFKYFPYGGLQRDFLQIAQECRQRGYAIRVYTLSWDGDIPDGFDVRLVPVRALRNHTRAKRFSDWVQAALKADPVTAVIGFNKMPGLDVYYAADNCFLDKLNRRKGILHRLDDRYKVYAALERQIFDNSDTGILMVSELQKEGYSKCYPLAKNRVEVVAPGISEARKRPENAERIREEFRLEFGVGDDEYILLQIGSGFKTKGVDRSIAALASLPSEYRRKTRLFVVGKDHDRTFKSLARKLGVEESVQFFGGRDDVMRFLLGADLMIHPAVNEAGGLVLLEAMASGLPVLCTAACGHAPHIEAADGGAVLAEPFDQQRLNESLLNLLADNALPELGENGVLHTEKNEFYKHDVHVVDAIERALGADRI